jgi:hypothetical protein
MSAFAGLLAPRHPQRGNRRSEVGGSRPEEGLRPCRRPHRNRPVPSGGPARRPFPRTATFRWAPVWARMVPGRILRRQQDRWLFASGATGKTRTLVNILTTPGSVVRGAPIPRLDEERSRVFFISRRPAAGSTPSPTIRVSNITTSLGGARRRRDKSSSTSSPADGPPTSSSQTAMAAAHPGSTAPANFFSHTTAFHHRRAFLLNNTRARPGNRPGQDLKRLPAALGRVRAICVAGPAHRDGPRARRHQGSGACSTFCL